jgi:hypothetical protein
MGSYLNVLLMLPTYKFQTSDMPAATTNFPQHPMALKVVLMEAVSWQVAAAKLVPVEER